MEVLVDAELITLPLQDALYSMVSIETNRLYKLYEVNEERVAGKGRDTANGSQRSQRWSEHRPYCHPDPADLRSRREGWRRISIIEGRDSSSASGGFRMTIEGERKR
ncbi:MAG: hypothetical protein HY277_08315 [Ignavibacteriales bacterium]|nr:hypothetical protein [Ignavibacteriales bacterium]